MKYAAFFLAVAALAVAGCQGGDTSTAPDATTGTASKPPATGGAPSTAGYSAIQDTFNANCVSCHGADHPKAALNLTSYDGVMKGNDDGAVVKAGDPDGSLLVQVLDAGHKPHMPPKSQLDPAKVDAIKAWIKDGAKNG